MKHHDPTFPRTYENWLDYRVKSKIGGMRKLNDAKRKYPHDGSFEDKYLAQWKLVMLVGHMQRLNRPE